MLQRKINWLAAAMFSLVFLLGTGACSSKDGGLKIKRVEPNEGAWEGGDQVTIYGSGFAKGGTRNVDVFFGKEKARVTSFESDDKMIVETPGGKKDQQVDIVIIFADSRQTKLNKAFTYIDSAAGFGIEEATKK